MMDHNSDTLEKNEAEDNFEEKIESIISRRMTQYRNSVLVSQIKKAIPNTLSFEKRNSLHNILQQISEESIQDPTQQQIIFGIPRKSVQNVEDCIVAGNTANLFTDSFVQNLPLSIAEKRLYRKSISVSLKRKPWSTKLRNFVLKKWENFISYFDFWHESLNIIEGQHGAAIVSYFVFIRWLLYMNIAIFFLNFIFLVLPQIFVPKENILVKHHTMSYFLEPFSNINNSFVQNYTGNDEFLKKSSSVNFLVTENTTYFSVNTTNFTSVEGIVNYCQILYVLSISQGHSNFIAVIQSFLQGTGLLEPTHLFTGFYTPFNIRHQEHIYNTSFAFLCVFCASFLISFYMMIQYSSIGVQEAFTVRKKKTNFYSNEVFSAWEYCIKKQKSADHLHHQFVFRLKTTLNEDRSAKEIIQRSTRMWIKLYSIRIFINILLLIWLIACCYLIYFVAAYQMREQQKNTLLEPGLRTLFLQFLPSFTLIILSSISPILFKSLVIFEKYSAQVESNLSIVRNLFLTLSSVIILLNTFYNQVACKPKDICGAGLDATCRSPRCWETYIGQQLYKLIFTKVFVLIGVFFCSDALKYYITKKYDNKITRLLGVPEFSLPSEVLAAINSQTIFWLGVFYSPLLPAMMILKLILIFQIKKMKLLKFCASQESSYRASKINHVFIYTMLFSFFVVLVVQSFAIDSIPPSRGCGPFKYFNHMTESIPVIIRSWLSILMSYWVLMFIIFILCIAIYYYWRMIASQKELLKRLKAHLVIQSYDKQFLLKSIAELKNKKKE